MQGHMDELCHHRGERLDAGIVTETLMEMRERSRIGHPRRLTGISQSAQCRLPGTVLDRRQILEEGSSQVRIHMPKVKCCPNCSSIRYEKLGDLLRGWHSPAEPTMPTSPCSGDLRMDRRVHPAEELVLIDVDPDPCMIES